MHVQFQLRTARPRQRTMALAAIIAAYGLAVLSLHAAEIDSNQAETIQAYLTAGEFAPAIELAQRAAQNDRDRWLTEIAQRQQAAGARAAAYDTLSQVNDSQLRSAALAAEEPPVRAFPALGGGVQVDFESLITLIQNTIAPTSWADVGGAGAVEEFAGGVYIDPAGTMRPRVEEQAGTGLSALMAALDKPRQRPGSVHRLSTLRKVSLPRLEREIQLRLAAGQPLDEAMYVLAGLQRVQYVMIYPETGDVVLAGPAGDWRVGAERRLVAVEGGRPVVRLDDLLVLLRHLYAGPAEPLGCSITPTQEGLSAAQAFLDSHRGQPLRPGQREAWLDQLRDALGQQTIDVYGVDPQTRVAAVILEADYRMKLVGIGLEEGTLGVPSYLDMLTAEAAGQPMDVLRWWFTLDYKTVQADPQRQVYHLDGRGVRVLSENELLNERGQRVHTGKSSENNQQFAHRFTEHFEALATKYPVYAELQNIFNLSLAVALIRSEHLADRSGWQLTCFLDDEQLPVLRQTAPQGVDSVINHRELDERHFVAAVSGGVKADPWHLVKAEEIAIDQEGRLDSSYYRSQPDRVPHRGWWWD